MQKEHIARFGTVFFLVLTFFVAVLTVKAIKEYQFIGYDPSDKRTIDVTGEGEAFAVPDVATFSFTVREEGKTVADAQKKATDKMNAALKSVKDSGVEEKDYRTIGYNVYPKYEYVRSASRICADGLYCQPEGRQVIVGYEVSQTIEVKVRDTAKAGDLLTMVGSAGASEVSGLEFTIDDEDKVKEEARAKAIADARAKAERLAETLGVRIGKVAAYSESSGGGYPMYYKREAMAMDQANGSAGAAPQAATVPMGENKVISNVTVTYELW